MILRSPFTGVQLTWRSEGTGIEETLVEAVEEVNFISLQNSIKTMDFHQKKRGYEGVVPVPRSWEFTKKTKNGQQAAQQTEGTQAVVEKSRKKKSRKAHYD